VSKGGYNGGSTLLGGGHGWSFDPDFPSFPKKHKPSPSGNSSPKNAKRKQTVLVTSHLSGNHAITPTIQKADRRAKALPLSRDAALEGLKIVLPKKIKDRAAVLKVLVDQGILLPTGSINPDNGRVATILKQKTKGKK
jgi:hypothetical protein